jgi:hypothetical protein
VVVSPTIPSKAAFGRVAMDGAVLIPGAPRLAGVVGQAGAQSSSDGRLVAFTHVEGTSRSGPTVAYRRVADRRTVHGSRPCHLREFISRHFAEIHSLSQEGPDRCVRCSPLSWGLV